MCSRNAFKLLISGCAQVPTGVGPKLDSQSVRIQTVASHTGDLPQTGARSDWTRAASRIRCPGRLTLGTLSEQPNLAVGQRRGSDAHHDT